MPAYNAEKYISEAIESVLAQNYDNWELIIVDDGSTDKTYEVANNYAQKCDKIVLVKQANSGTAAAARNTALRYVTGDYIQMLDSDDKLSANCLEVYAKCLKDRESDYDALSPICMSIDSKGDEIEEIACASEYVGNTLSGAQAFYLSLDWRIHGFICVKSSILKTIKYDELLLNGDEFTSRKLLYSSKKIGFTKSVYYYRVNDASTTRASQNQYRMTECVITKGNIYDYAVKNHMDNNTIEYCYVLWVKLLFDYQYKNATSNGWSIEHKQYSSSILKDQFLKISRENYKVLKNPYCLGVYLSFRRYKIFQLYANLAGKLYDMIKGRH